MLAVARGAGADGVTDANVRAAEIRSMMAGTPPAVRAMAIVQVSVYEASTRSPARYPQLRTKLTAAPGASWTPPWRRRPRTRCSSSCRRSSGDRGALSGRAQAAADGRAKTDGIAVGEQAATAVAPLCAEDGAMAPNAYGRTRAAGVYVPDGVPVVPHWGERKPWVMTSGDQFRPGLRPA
jgi:hypothetical protein